MNKLSDVFKDKKAFIPFITCGDPDLETTEQIVYAMERAGADIIELGIPFSDPTAEGPVIMEADIRALKAKTTTKKVFDMVNKIRKNSNIPLVFMTYANVVFSYGIENFAKECARLSVAGLILPDLPFEEKKEFLDVFEKYEVDIISLIAPTSNDRIKMIAKEARGFLYLVSSLGVTGVRNEITTDISAMIKLVREVSDIPIAIGFGISTKEQAKQMSKLADGVIVGSAIVKLCERYANNSISHIEKFVKEMKEAIN